MIADDISKLWCRLTDIYGHKWTSAHGENDVDGTWQRGLSGLVSQDLAEGLKQCVLRSKDRARSGDEDWPPTLGEFREYCMWHRTRPASHDLAPQLTYKKPVLTAEEKQDIHEMLLLAGAGKLGALEAYITEPKAKQMLQQAHDLDHAVRAKFGDKYADNMQKSRIDLGALGVSGLAREAGCDDDF